MRRASRERDELPGERAHERVHAGAGAARAQAAGARDGPGQQRVALGQGEEGRDVVVDRRAGSAGGRARTARRARRGRSLSVAVAALGDARVRGPRRRREHELGAVVVQAQRAVAHAAERHAQVVRAARAQLDRASSRQQLRGSAAAPRRSRARPRRASRRAARRSRSRSSWSRGSPSAGGHVEPRRGDVGSRLQQRGAAAAALGEPEQLAAVAASRARTSPCPAKQASRAAARSATGSAAASRGVTARSSRRAPRAPPAAPAPASGRTARRRRSRARWPRGSTTSSMR